MPSFAQLAPYLTHPLVLAGLAIWLVLGIHRALLRAKIVPTLSQHAGGRVVQTLLRYGFYIALLVILLGFGLAFYQARQKLDPNLQRSQSDKARLDGLVAMALGFCQQPNAWVFDEATRRDAALACAKAVAALTQSTLSGQSKEEALERLKSGDSQGAKDLFQIILDQKIAEGRAANKEAAEAARHLAAIAFVGSTGEALVAYRRAVELDPDNLEGLIAFGSLAGIVGQISDAESAFEKAQNAAATQGNRAGLADALSHLSWIYDVRGNLSMEEEINQRALDIDVALDRKASIAADYRRFGEIQLRCGDLAKAESLFRQSLSIDEAVVNAKPGLTGNSILWQVSLGLANDYENLGSVYLARGDSAQAKEMYQLSLDLNKLLGIKPGSNNDCFCGLGNLYLSQGDLDRAEEMHKKALAIEEALDFRLGIAAQYSNLGDVYLARQKASQARTMYKQSLEIDESLGYKRGIAYNFRALGLLYKQRWFLGQSEAMLSRALQIDEDMTCRRSMAADHADLGDLYLLQGNLKQAEAKYRESYSLLVEIGGSTSPSARALHERIDALVARQKRQT